MPKFIRSSNRCHRCQTLRDPNQIGYWTLSTVEYKIGDRVGLSATAKVYRPLPSKVTGGHTFFTMNRAERPFG